MVWGGRQSGGRFHGEVAQGVEKSWLRHETRDAKKKGEKEKGGGGGERGGRGGGSRHDTTLSMKAEKNWQIM